MRGKSAHATDLTRARLRDLEAVKLRASGLTYTQIAADLGISETGARKAVKRSMEKIKEELRESAADLRNLELERLDALQYALWAKATAGDVQAVDRVLRVMTRRAALLGLDVPPSPRIESTEPIEIRYRDPWEQDRGENDPPDEHADR